MSTAYIHSESVLLWEYRSLVCPCRGGCNEGADCNFAHGEAELRGPPTALPVMRRTDSGILPKRKLCAFFGTPKGCLKGDSCDFAHGEAELEGTPGTPTTATSSPMRRCDSDTMLGHRAADSARSKIRPCTFFNTPKGCRNGRACGFAHVRGAGAPGAHALLTGPRAAPPGRGARPTPSPRRKR